MNQILKTIKQRRSIRSYKKEQIKDDELNQIIEAALWSPSGHNMQGWHFTVVQNQNYLDELSFDTKEVVKKFHVEDLRKLASNEKYHMFYNAPTVILVLSDENSLTPVQDVSAATENILLAAESLGIGSCWVGMIRLTFKDEENAKKYSEKFNLPRGYQVSHAITLGYPKNKVAQGPKRKENKVNFIK